MTSATYIPAYSASPAASSGALPGPSARAPEASQPLDPGIFGVLLELAAGLPGFLAELSEEFRQGVGRQVAAIRVAVGSGDTAGLKFAAHSIRGSCGTIGACGMAAIAGRLEDAPPTSPEAGWPLIERLETEYEAVRRALEAFAPAAAPASMA